VKNGRESFNPSNCRNFIHETKKYRGITESVLTTAVKVDDEVKKTDYNLYFGHLKTTVELKENRLDPEINRRRLSCRSMTINIDASIKNKLRKIKKELIGMCVSLQ